MLGKDLGKGIVTKGSNVLILEGVKGTTEKEGAGANGV